MNNFDKEGNMKRTLTTLILIIATQSVFANDAASFLKEKADLDSQSASMSCNELKDGLPKLASNIDAIKYEKPGTVKYDIALYAVKLALRKASKCI